MKRSLVLILFLMMSSAHGMQMVMVAQRHAEPEKPVVRGSIVGRIMPTTDAAFDDAQFQAMVKK